MNRRELLKLLAASGVYYSTRSMAESNDAPLEPWSPGELEIHHIDTGRGNATFILAPDGTTILVDCGEIQDASALIAPSRPNNTRRAGEWVARYAQRVANAAGRSSIDYMIATHVHPDHVGEPPKNAVPGPQGYVPTGLSLVDDLMPAHVVIDRGYPDYGNIKPSDAPFAANYLAWLNARTSSGRSVEKLIVGSDKQIHLRGAFNGPEFAVRGLVASGVVWTGKGQGTRSLIPDAAKLSAGVRPTENQGSLALRVSFGDFSYFTGGDLCADTHDGREPWMDVESAVVDACGRVEVALADHHGYFDACGPEFVKALDAQAYVIPAWHISHPGQAQLERLLGAWPGEKPRAVYSTEMLTANRDLNERWVKLMQSTQGHVIVRVAGDAKSYKIFVADSTVEEQRIVHQSQRFICRR